MFAVSKPRKEINNDEPIFVKCCNEKQCSNLIKFDNKKQFESCINDRNPLTKCYIANKYGLSNNDKNTFYRFIYGKYIRIFCNYCSINRLQICEWNKTSYYGWCSNDELKSCLYKLSVEPCYNTYPVCSNHPILCHFCKKIQLTNECQQCHMNFCKKCLIGKRRKKQCKSCIDKKKVSQLTEIIFNASQISHFTKYIAQILAAYAIGFVVECCNKDMPPCDNEISFDELELEKEEDYKSNKIYYYEPSFAMHSNNKPTVMINGDKLRIFCSVCTKTKLNKCPYCFIMETGNTQCGNHPFCNKCNGTIAECLKCYIGNKCVKCSKLYCMFCSVLIDDKKYCESCAVAEEYDVVMDGISNVLKILNIDCDRYIIKKIAYLSVGFVFKCCNKEDKCNNDVIIDSKYQFERRENYERQKIYYYKPKYRQRDKAVELINNKKMRIFCDVCTKDRIKKCAADRYMYDNISCSFMESGDTRCGMHYNCCICGSRWNSDAMRCKECEQSMCTKCVYIVENRNYCKQCGMNKTLNDLVEIIWNSSNILQQFDGNKTITKLVAMYSVGFVFQCCYEDGKCDNDIAFDNMWQFKQRRNCESKQIYYETIHGYMQQLQQQRVIIFNNREYRMFCAECTAHNFDL